MIAPVPTNAIHASGVVEITHDNLHIVPPEIVGAANPALSIRAKGEYLLVYHRQIGSDHNIFRRGGTGPKL